MGFCIILLWTPSSVLSVILINLWLEHSDQCTDNQQLRYGSYYIMYLPPPSPTWFEHFNFLFFRRVPLREGGGFIVRQSLKKQILSFRLIWQVSYLASSSRIQGLVICCRTSATRGLAVLSQPYSGSYSTHWGYTIHIGVILEYTLGL